MAVNNIIERTLVSVLKDNRLAKNIRQLSTVLQNEQYILFFYANILSERGITLDRQILQSSLIVNSEAWLNPKVAYRDNIKMLISKDYLNRKVKEEILLDSEYNDVLISVVMYEYDRLLSIDTGNFNVIDSLPLILEEIRYLNGLKLYQELSDLIVNNRQINKKIYTQRELIPYITDRLKEIDSSIYSIDKESDYRSGIKNIILSGGKSNKILLDFNFSSIYSVPSLRVGHHFSLIGAPKAGKTSLCIGEIVYPLILQGLNVEYDASETKKIDIIAKLIAKHGYVKQNKIKIPIKVIKNILYISELLNHHNLTLKAVEEEFEIRKKIIKGIEAQKTISDEIFQHFYDAAKELKEYKTYKKELIEFVKLIYFELFLSGKYGKVTIYTVTEDEAMNVFNVDSMVEQSIERVIENDISCLIRDHAGHFKSNDKNKSEVQILKQVYEGGQLIAQNKKHPCLVVTTNHMDTKSSDKVNTLGEDRSSRIEGRAYGSSESTKSCDLEAVIYSSREDKRDGVLRFDIKASRDESDVDMLILKADNGVCDYYIDGHKKGSYFDITENE